MADRPVLVLQQLVADLPDPRVEHTKRHALLEIITSAVCAVVSGADTWVDVEGWGLALTTNQPPPHAAVETCFAEVEREAWQGVVHEHRVTAAAGHGRLVPRRYWTSYYLSRLEGTEGTVATVARAVRGHWGIENRQHWT